MLHRAHLNLQCLESREVPAQFGIPWDNGTVITVSFAPDGTNVDGTASELSSLMADSGLSPAIWQGEVLRAFQAWASQADINIGVVADSGATLGAAGKPQADPRFGDIRIFAAPLASSVLAITMPPGDLSGTRTGDIILNSNYNFGVGSGNDLYTVLLQEAGHAFGVGNSGEVSSAMYEFYQGPRSGLSSSDVSQIRALYGARRTNTWEPDGGDNTSGTGTNLLGNGTLVTYGDVAKASDTDWYTFVATTNSTTTVTLRTNGISLLAGQIGVFDPNQDLIGSTSHNLAGQDLTLDLVGLTIGSTYSIRVRAAAGTPFEAGAYQLRVVAGSSAQETVSLGGAAPLDDAGTNETALTATRLATQPDRVADYRIFGQLRIGDKDVYTVRAPQAGMNQGNVLTATIRGFAGGLSPKIVVTNSLGLTVGSTVVADGNGLYTVRVSNATSGADYNLVVTSRNNLAGAYELRSSFRATVTTPYSVASGLLTLLNPSVRGSLEVTGSAQIYFRLSSALLPVVGPSVMLQIIDTSNNVRFQLLAKAGDKVDGVALLGTGTYRVRIVGNGSLLPFIASAYTLETALLTDPVGVTPTDPNSGGSTTPPPSGYKYKNSSGTVVRSEQTPTSGSGL